VPWPRNGKRRSASSSTTSKRTSRGLVRSGCVGSATTLASMGDCSRNSEGWASRSPRTF